MEYYERIGNLHMHTYQSDGAGDFDDLAAAAQRAGLDFIIVTDHNVYSSEFEGWYGRTLLLEGQEEHAPANPTVNHCLVFGANEDMAPCGDDPQRLLDAVNARGGRGFIAHPYEHSGAFTSEPEINWTAWSASGYAGVELWNYMSEFKSYLANPLAALLYAFWPRLAIRGPYRETLAKWDELLAAKRVAAIGGADAHGQAYRLGPIKRRVFSYEHLFRAVNTHILAPADWSRDVRVDGRMIYDALAEGRAFIGYDGLAPTRGFAFFAECDGQIYTLGDEFAATKTAQFHVRAPAVARIKLLLNGFYVAEARGDRLSYSSRAPGVYRVEVYRSYMGRPRGWILSNPIIMKPKTDTQGGGE